MDYILQNKIFGDKKLNKYLKENSQWYKFLNRSTDNYKLFYDEYKKYSRETSQKKISAAVETLDTVNTIFKIIN